MSTVDAATAIGATQEVGPGWIQVGGRGQVSIEPDRASVRVALESRAGTAAEAAEQNAEVMNRVLTALRSAGVPGLEIETSGYALNPEYQVSNDGRRVREIVAYQAMNSVQATVSDVEGVGVLVDAAITAGANRITSISFFASDTEDARRQALALAVESARAEAEVIATSLGYELGPPLEVTGGAQRPMPYEADMAMRSAGMAAAAPPLEAGSQIVTADVSIRFALGPESGG